MKTDKIFYTLFQVFPELLFQLIGESPDLAQNYEFKSIEVKELSFRLDGVYLPNQNLPDIPIYFVEVQFQKDENFYWRFIAEVCLYLNQYKPDRPCQVIVLWANQNLDEGLPIPYQYLLGKNSIQRIYLDQINTESPKSLGLSIIEFIIASASEATKQVPSLINQAKQEVIEPISQQNVIELIETIIVYKFPEKSRKELEVMFNLTEWRQTKFYQETKLEGKLETVPLLLQLGLKPEEIAQKLAIDLEIIRQHIANQNN